MHKRRFWKHSLAIRLRLSLLAVLCVGLLGGQYGSPVSQAEAGERLDPAALAIYYGWPSLVNGSNYDTAAAAAVFGQYQAVIFSEGVEEYSHGDHYRTAQIIQILHRDYDTRVFGYMDAPRWGTIWTRYGSDPSGWVDHMDMWVAMGVDGIFVDRFSYDWNITRTMQNDMVDAIHSRGVPAFVNGWFVDNVFSSEPDIAFPQGNPQGLPSHMQATDMYLLESFTIFQGQYDVCVQPYIYPDSWIEKANKAFIYHQVFGTEMWTMTTANQLMTAGIAAAETVDPRLSYAWHVTAMYGFQGFGWTEPNFSATGVSKNLLPWRPRPSPNLPAGTGTQYLNEVQHLGDLHTRDTDLGQFRVICSVSGTRSAEFIANLLTPSTPTVTSSPSATISPTATYTFTATPTSTPTLTSTPSPVPFTETPTATLSPTATASSTMTVTATPSPTPTPTATPSLTPTLSSTLDSDGDGMPDVYELKFVCLNPLTDDADANSDEDAYQNISEYRLQTDPCQCNPLHDVDGDTEVTISDVLMFVPHWNETPASPGWIAEYDPDGDGMVTVLDFMFVVSRIGDRCDAA